MRKIIPLLILSFIVLSSCNKKPEDAVADATKKYREINEKLPDYKSRQVDDITSSAAGTITGYYRDNEVKKIYAEHFSDTNRVFTEYYFDDGMLIFILQQTYTYNRPDTYTEEKAVAAHDSVWYDDKKTKLGIDRFYFSKNKLVKWIPPSGKEVTPATSAFIDKESVLWAQAAILIKELKETSEHR